VPEPNNNSTPVAPTTPQTDPPPVAPPPSFAAPPAPIIPSTPPNADNLPPLNSTAPSPSTDLPPLDPSPTPSPSGSTVPSYATSPTPSPAPPSAPINKNKNDQKKLFLIVGGIILVIIIVSVIMALSQPKKSPSSATPPIATAPTQFAPATASSTITTTQDSSATAEPVGQISLTETIVNLSSSSLQEPDVATSTQLSCLPASESNKRVCRIYANSDLNFTLPVIVDVSDYTQILVWNRDNKLCFGHQNDRLLCLEFFENGSGDTIENIVRNDYFAQLTFEQQNQCRIVRATDGTISITPINAATTTTANCGDYAAGYFTSFVDSPRYVFVSESYTGTYPIDFFLPLQIKSLTNR
jgi:hypothetical protein